MNRTISALLLLMLACATVPVHAEEEEEQHALPLPFKWELGFWTGGGTGVSGSTKDTQLIVGGVRLGKRVTRIHGKGIFRGNLEYVVEAIPVFVVFQSNTVYGFDLTPFLWKWNFVGNHKIIPYFEAGAGMLFTMSDVPERTSRFNFTPQSGVGVHVLLREKQAATLSFKYMHISNGGLEKPNPGINSLQIQAGYQWFF